LNKNFLWIAVAFVLSKGTIILKALKAIKYAKFAITAITTILYGFAFGSWYFATGFVLLLLVHEYGHVMAMWRKGVRASAPVFIPFLGAAIFAEIPEKKTDEAYIGYGGPLVGTLGALACVAVAFALEAGSFWSTLLHILGNVGLFINLFNMIPARPLDGGRILHPLGKGVAYCGFALLLLLAFALEDMFFVLIALFVVAENMPVRKWVTRMLFGMFFAVLAAKICLSLLLESGIVVGGLFALLSLLSVFMFFLAWWERHTPLPEEDIETDPVSLFSKAKWFAYYVALVLIIGGSMMWHSQHLPKEVAESSLVRFFNELE